MFEKEAEEYVRTIWHDVNNWGGKEPEERFYNEIKFKQAYLAGAEFGYNKANEWHYVKDGEYPRQYEHTRFSIYVLANNKKWVYYDFSSDKWFCVNKEVNVIAWKEIVFPKEI